MKKRVVVSGTTGVLLLILALAALAILPVKPFDSMVRPGEPSQPCSRGDETALTWGTVERDLSPDGCHAYRLDLAAGRFVELELELEGIDALVALTAPSGEELFSIPSYDPIGTLSPLTALTAEAGLYRLEIRARPQGELAGRYELKLIAERPAKAGDEVRIEADRLLAEGTRLYAQQTAETLQEAQKRYQAALDRLQTIDEPVRTAQTLYGLGALAKDRGEQAQARELYQSALKIQRATKNRRDAALTLSNLGWIEIRLGNLAAAETALQEALRLFSALEDRHCQALVYDNLGQLHRARGEFRQAVESYRQAMSYFATSRDYRTRAIVFNNLALACDELGDFKAASGFYRQAIAGFEAIDNKNGKAAVHTNLARLFQRLGDREGALQSCLQGLELYRELGNQRLEGQVAGICSEYYAAAGRHEEALELIDKSLTLTEQAGERLAYAYGFYRKARFLRNLQRQAEASPFDDQALLLFRQLRNAQGEASVLSDLGEADRVAGDFHSAHERFHKALELNRAAGDRVAEGHNLLRLALLDRDEGDLEGARGELERAIERIDSTWVELASPYFRSTLRDSVETYYSTYIEVLMALHARQPERGLDAVALEAFERGRARGLIELLREARIDLREGAPPALLQSERELRERLAELELERARQLSQEDGRASDPAMDRAVDELLVRYRGIEEELRAENPQLRTLARPRDLDLDALRRKVLSDSRTLVLAYGLGAERSFLWALTESSLASHELPPAAVIEEKAKRLYELLTAPGRWPEFETDAERQARLDQAERLYRQEASELSRLLLQPVAELLEDRRLIIISDGALQYLPFAALPDPRALSSAGDPADVPLLLRHEIVSLPSLSTLVEIRRRRHQHPPLLAVIADPVFARQDPRARGPSAGAAAEGQVLQEAEASDPVLTRAARDLGLNGFSRLPGSREEALRISALAPAGSLRRLGFAANRDLVMSGQLAPYGILHFATHAVLDARRPELSGLVLSLVAEDGRPINGFLRLHDIYRLELNADLVVLSACQTALGEEIHGEGLIGLVRGFMHAGAATVIASLWSPRDDATAELMARFYRVLFAEKRPAASALRAAQLSLRQEGAWRTPFFWAGFIVQGEFASPAAIAAAMSSSSS